MIEPILDHEIVQRRPLDPVAPEHSAIRRRREQQQLVVEIGRVPREGPAPAFPAHVAVGAPLRRAGIAAGVQVADRLGDNARGRGAPEKTLMPRRIHAHKRPTAQHRVETLLDAVVDLTRADKVQIHRGAVDQGDPARRAADGRLARDARREIGFLIDEGLRGKTRDRVAALRIGPRRR